MMIKVSPIPEGYRTVTPNLTFKDTSKALKFYHAAFDAETLENLPRPDSSATMHALIRIGDSLLMMGDEMPGAECSKSPESLGGTSISMYVYVPNVDSAFAKAIGAGAVSVMPVADMFWGDRCGSFKDPFGYQWTVATHTRDLKREDVQEGAKAFFDEMRKSSNV